MKLQIRRTYGATGEALVLTDELGRMLPGQKAVAINQRVGDETTVTVEMIVDGDRLSLNTSRTASDGPEGPA